MTGRRVPIGTVANSYGVSATTLRYWEDLGLLPPQERSGGQRRYDLDALRRVMFIRMAKQSGLSLNAIRALLAGNDHHGPTFDDWARVARQQLEVIDQRVEVVFLAEEGRQVGGQAVDELLPLGLRARAAFQPFQVVLERCVTCFTQTA